jgi:hypothetical protein
MGIRGASQPEGVVEYTAAPLAGRHVRHYRICYSVDIVFGEQVLQQRSDEVGRTVPSQFRNGGS